MENKHTTFKLLGCKIKELPNGYFIVQKPNMIESLFDNNCNIIKTGLTNIKQLSTIYYTGDTENSTVIFNNKGNLIDKSKNIYISFATNSISVKHKGFENVYGIDGRTQFKGIKSKRNIIIQKYSKTCLACIDKNNKAYIVNSKGEIINFKKDTDVTSINNHYIVHKCKGKKLMITDYEGNEIIQGKHLRINEINSEDTFIVDTYKDNNLVYNSKGSIAYSVPLNDSNYSFTGLSFTSVEGVIVLEKIGDGSYLVNLNKNNEISRKYRNINSRTLMPTYTKDGQLVMAAINSETFETIREISGYINFRYERPFLKAYKNGGGIDYYSEELRQLLCEF